MERRKTELSLYHQHRVSDILLGTLLALLGALLPLPLFLYAAFSLYRTAR
jgi:hypothetical protein